MGLARTSLIVRPTSAASLPAAWLAAALSAALLAAWELGSRAGAVAPLLFPAPTTILATAVSGAVGGDLPFHVGRTLTRVGLGLLLGGVPGVLLGLLMGGNVRLRGVLDPFVAAAHAVPKIAIFPLVMVALGVGEPPKVAIAAMGAFFPLLISAMDGVRQISPTYFEVARNVGLSPGRRVVRVLLPGGLPAIMSGLRLGANNALLLTIAAEMIAGREGLGASIWRAWETMRATELYANLLAIVLIGVGMNVAVRFLAKRVVPWQIDR